MFAGPLDEAKVFISRGEVDHAINTLSGFLNSDFYHDEALFMLGACYMSKGLNGLGAVATSAAIDARKARGKDFPEALMNLGGCYKAEHQNDIASRVWADALNCEPLPRERAKIMTNIAGLYVNEGNPEIAVDWCDRALKEDPHCVKAKVQRGMACLELGRWREGWEGWAYTYAAGDRTMRSYGNIPVWDGSEGRHVIVWGDQGIGDEIYYAACLKDLARVSRKITLDCHPRLPGLFKRSFPEFEVHGTRKNLSELPWLRNSDADAHVCLADLPGFFRNNGEWDRKPYIKADPYPDLNHSGFAGHLRIGLSWTGGTKRTRNDLRSVPIDLLEQILRARPDATWYSLQYTPEAARDVCALEEKTGIRISHFPGWVECYDYDRTASFVSSLDLVITVCTTAHHLGGALGVPTWTLVPKRASWRYGVKGETSPWYGSVKLFRQQVDGDWAGPINCIASELEAMR